VITANVEAGTLLRVTTHGAIVVMGDAYRVEHLAAAIPVEWIPGHLN
jgi:hypothetical protein